MSKPRVVVVTNIRSYHQVDLFDAVADLGDIELCVLYLRPMTPGRQWTTLPQPRHPYRMLPMILGASSLYFNPTILNELSKLKPDLAVICQYSSISYQAAMAHLSLRATPWVFWSESPGVKFFEVSSSTPEHLRPFLRRLAFFQVSRFAKEVWGIGARAQKTLETLGARDTLNLPYFSDLSRFARRNEPYAPGGKVRFLFAGRLSYRKGFDTVCGAFSHLSNANRRDWSLTVCGSGPMTELLERASDLKHRVHDVGFKELSEMPDVMRSHDILIAPSRYDGWGMVTPEALAAGLAVITTDQMESAACIGENQPTLSFVPLGSAEALFQKLVWWLDNKEKLETYGKVAASLASPYDVRRGAKRFSEMALRVAGAV